MGLVSIRALFVCLFLVVQALAAPVPKAASLHEIPNEAPRLPPDTTRPKILDVRVSFSDLDLGRMLLRDPDGTPTPYGNENYPEGRRIDVQNAIMIAGIEIEIFDAKEYFRFFVRREEFQSDLDVLRRRVASLKDVPLIQYTQRFPHVSVIDNALAHNRQIRKELMERLLWEADRADLILVVIREVDMLYKLWKMMRDSVSTYYPVSSKRESLKEYLQALELWKMDPEEVPASVPYWRFPNS